MQALRPPPPAPYNILEFTNSEVHPPGARAHTCRRCAAASSAAAAAATRASLSLMS